MKILSEGTPLSGQRSLYPATYVPAETNASHLNLIWSQTKAGSSETSHA